MTKQEKFVHFAAATAIIGACARSADIAKKMTYLLSTALETSEESIPDDWRTAVQELMQYARGKAPRPAWAPEIAEAAVRKTRR